MKLRSLKNMALWFTLATMANSGSVFAHSHHSHSHHHHHSHSHSHPKFCKITVEQIRNFGLPVIEALNGIVGNLNEVFVAQAFATDPISADIVALTAAENGFVTPIPFGTIAADIAVIGPILLALGGNPVAVNDIVNVQLPAFTIAAEAYSTAVAQGQPEAVTTSLFDAWLAVGTALAQDIVALSSPGVFDFDTVQAVINNLINSEGRAVQAWSQVLITAVATPEAQFAAGVANDQEAHIAVTELGRMMVEHLICLELPIPL